MTKFVEKNNVKVISEDTLNGLGHQTAPCKVGVLEFEEMRGHYFFKPRFLNTYGSKILSDIIKKLKELNKEREVK